MDTGHENLAINTTCASFLSKTSFCLMNNNKFLISQPNKICERKLVKGKLLTCMGLKYNVADTRS